MAKTCLAILGIIHCVWLNRFTYGLLDCYQCNNIQNITDCHSLVQCNTDEYCYTETTGIGMYTRYSLGCRSKQTCLEQRITTTTTDSQLSIIGRALISTPECTQCCAVDACNKQLCSAGTHAIGNSQCKDDPAFNCPLISSTFNICGDIQHAKLSCKDFCGLCKTVDGVWSSWQSWSSCSVTCASGSQWRFRTCDNPPPRDGGLDCVGSQTQNRTCNLRECPVHGGWSRWAPWGTCSVTCGIGLARRDRSCSNPYPGPDGDPCYGDARDDRACFIRACADGHWSQWSSWGSCSATCLGGLQLRTRSCTNPSPSSFGHDCVGNSEDRQTCNTVYCQEINGRWSTWNSWGSCSNALRRRTRLCNNPAPSAHGHSCLGNNEQVSFCGEAFGGVRLTGHQSLISGRVEVFHTTWGTVCDDGFDDDDAKVICNMLGFETHNPYAIGSARFGQGTLPIILDDLSCVGTEESIYSCSHRAWFTNNCGHGEDASVICAPMIRLVGGSGSSGRVEVKYKGEWGTVCDDGFGPVDAKVVCRSLGLPTAHASAMTNNPGSGKILLDDMGCTGTERSLEECPHTAWGHHDCGHDEDVSVTCT